MYKSFLNFLEICSCFDFSGQSESCGCLENFGSARSGSWWYRRSNPSMLKRKAHKPPFMIENSWTLNRPSSTAQQNGKAVYQHFSILHGFDHAKWWMKNGSCTKSLLSDYTQEFALRASFFSLAGRNPGNCHCYQSKFLPGYLGSVCSVDG